MSFSNEKVIVHFFIYRMQLTILKPSNTHHLDVNCKLDETNTSIVNLNSTPKGPFRTSNFASNS